MKRILIIDEMHESIVPLLEGIGTQPDYQPTIDPKQVPTIINNYDGLVLRSKMKITDSFLKATNRLKFIARAGAGVDQIDEATLKEKKITLLNAPEGNRDAVGEHAVGMLLSLLHKLHSADKEVRNFDWKREANRGYELGKLTVGIIGYGNMGGAFAKRLSGFGCNVLAYDKYRKNYADQYAKAASLDDLFEQANVLSLHIPLNKENRNLIDKSFLDKFKNPIFLVNTARGEVVPLESVLYGLEHGQLRGAALDVLENEKMDKLSESQKATMEKIMAYSNVLLTPHVAGWTYESYRKINEVLAKKISVLLNSL